MKEVALALVLAGVGLLVGVGIGLTTYGEFAYKLNNSFGGSNHCWWLGWNYCLVDGSPMRVEEFERL